MKYKLNIRVWTFLLLPALLLLPLQELAAQQDKVAAFKKSLAENQKRLRQYRWVETTIVSIKDEEKSRVQKDCFYGPDGKVQKQQFYASPEPEAPGGLKGKIAAKKKKEIQEYMEDAVGLVQQYVPPDAQRIQAAKDAGNLSLSPTAPGIVRLDFRDFVKPGDLFGLTVNSGTNAIERVSVKSDLGSEKDAVKLDASFASLNDGSNYPANIVLLAPAKNIQVVIQNSDYKRIASAAQPPPQQPQGLSTQQIDSLTGPIALYPDALVAQILVASTNIPQLEEFDGWMGQNASLTGSALQDAANNAGFATCYVALAPFPQVVQMLVQKVDWTQQLGAAFTADQKAVFASIQRLRAQAQALGNLKTTPQQEVVVQTTSSGQQVIVIQPANPEVVYVPVYSTQTVYVQSAPPPSSSSSSDAAAAAMVGFTAGIIIGAAASNNYYYGPYAWYGGGAYYGAGAWDNRAYNADQRQDTRQGNQSQRQDTRQGNQSQRQDTRQGNQGQRQNNAQGRQSTAQTNQSTRQSSASSAQSGASSGRSGAQTNQSQRQSAASTSSRGSGQTASQRSGMGSSGYQGGATTRSQSSRGSSSLSSSRGGGGGGRGGGGGGRGGGGGGRR